MSRQDERLLFYFVLIPLTLLFSKNIPKVASILILTYS
jgi:hypothetical protein